MASWSAADYKISASKNTRTPFLAGQSEDTLHVAGGGKIGTDGVMNVNCARPDTMITNRTYRYMNKSRSFLS